MPSIVVTGGSPLSGEVRVGGAKNSALKLMAASLLGSVPVALLYSFFMDYFVSGLTAGALKG